jgi:hypothetical protein
VTEIYSEAERRARAHALMAAHDEWVAEQVAAGVDGPVPPGRRDPSDYNQHVPDLESDGAAEDRFARRVAAALP